MRDSWTERAIRDGTVPPRTKAEHRAAGCEGKQRFETWSAANRVTRRRNRAHRQVFSIYRCTHCRGFHLGEPRDDG